MSKYSKHNKAEEELVKRLIAIRTAADKVSEDLIENYINDWYSNYSDLYQHAVRTSMRVASWPEHKQKTV